MKQIHIHIFIEIDIVLLIDVHVIKLLS